MGLARRLQFQAVLEEILGTEEVYFQAPVNKRMQYPCIVYTRDGDRTEFADNRPYSGTDRYQVTVIDANPDNDIREKVKQLPMCLFTRSFAANNLNHDVFTIFY